MAESAHVESIEALKYFRIALIKFAEAASSALGNAESDLQDMMNWLENEQQAFWQGQIRKRHDLVERAREALRMKRLFRDSAGRVPSAIEEEKALRLAQVREEEAGQKLLNVRKYTRVLQKEIQTYKGSVQRLMTTLESDIPVAATMLDGFVSTLEPYVTLAPADTRTPAPTGDEGSAPQPESQVQKPETQA